MTQNINLKNLIIIFSLTTIVLAFSARASVAQVTPQPFAVAELFTSEGCSSCPPADAILRNITEQAHASNTNIITLSFHVDYWDYLGWKDPASDARFSARQRKYAQNFQSRSVYTPQLVVNGQNGFGGYKNDLAQKYIQEALQKPPQTALDIKVDYISNNEIGIKYEARNLPKNSQLNIALVEREVATKVPKGENAGRTLCHANVVRVFQTTPIKSESGKLSIAKPVGFDPQKYALIGYLQNSDNMHIIGADQSDIKI